MSRPEKERKVHEPPIFTGFKPMGVNNKYLQQTILTLDEFEAFRLSDNIGLSHADAAEEMEISRSTFTRLIEKARKKMERKNCSIIVANLCSDKTGIGSTLGKVTVIYGDEEISLPEQPKPLLSKRLWDIFIEKYQHSAD